MNILDLFNIILGYCKTNEDYSLLYKEIETIDVGYNIDIRFEDGSVWYIYDGQLYKYES